MRRQPQCARTPTTHQLTSGEETEMKPISVWGWLAGHDGQRTMGKFGQDAEVTPLLFFEGHPGIFYDHRESGPRCLIRRTVLFTVVSPSLYWGVRTHTSFSGQPVLGYREIWLLAEILRIINVIRAVTDCFTHVSHTFIFQRLKDKWKYQMLWQIFSQLGK